MRKMLIAEDMNPNSAPNFTQKSQGETFIANVQQTDVLDISYL